jgi:hypothetical protein
VPRQGEISRRPAWPEDTVFRRLVLDVECDSCEHCGATLHVCDHRFHRIHTLQGSVELLCRLAHCSDCLCPLRCQTLSPAAELSLTLPWWTIGWDVFCWMLIWTCRPVRAFRPLDAPADLTDAQKAPGHRG